jgi:FkbM family methyltransferase
VGLRRYVLPMVLRYTGADTIEGAYRGSGIGIYGSAEETGEKSLLSSALPKLVTSDDPVFFDVGANTGEYSEALYHSFPKARVYAFEPVPSSFVALQRTLSNKPSNCYQLGLSDIATTAMIYDYQNQPGSQHASLFEDVLTKLHKSDAVTATSIELTTLDDFCLKHSINRIDFLKIDTEGNELKVLQGARSLLSRGAIRLAQFEFNEMNVVARVFLKDFYEILPGFDFYRLLSNGLLHLGPYSPRHEVFAFQNILAVKQGEFNERTVASLVSQAR